MDLADRVRIFLLYEQYLTLGLPKQESGEMCGKLSKAHFLDTLWVKMFCNTLATSPKSLSLTVKEIEGNMTCFFAFLRKVENFGEQEIFNKCYD